MQLENFMKTVPQERYFVVHWNPLKHRFAILKQLECAYVNWMDKIF